MFVSGGSTITVEFSTSLRTDGAADTVNYKLTPLDGGVPSQALTVTPAQTVLNTGNFGLVLSPTGSPTSNMFFTSGTTVMVSGDYLTVVDRWQTVTARVVSSPSVGIAVLDRTLVQSDQNGNLSWTHFGPVTGATIAIWEPTHNAHYQLDVSGLMAVGGAPYVDSGVWKTVVNGPQLLSVDYEALNGSFLLTFDKVLMIDDPLLNPAVYNIGGPTSVEVVGVRMAGPSKVVLLTVGVGAGSYNVFVASPYFE